MDDNLARLEKIDTASSEGGVMGLQELEPSPVEESPMEAYKDNYFPEARSPSPEPAPSPRPGMLSRTSTLGLNGHGPVYYLTRLQKYSSYTFTLFTAFHITNTSLIPLLTRSIAASDTYLLLTRPYYQSFPLEPLLIALPLGIHITSGLALRLYRRQQTLHRYGAESARDRRRVAWPALSGTSLAGYALTPLVLGHALVNRGLPLWYEGGSSSIGLEYVGHGFARHPLPSWVGFTALVGVAVGHSVWGWAKWMGWTPAGVAEGGEAGRRRRRWRWWAVNGVAAAVAALWLAGGLGVVGRGGEVQGWVGREYDELYRRIPVVGRWM